MKYSEVKKFYVKAWLMYLDPCFDGNNVARLLIEIAQLKARLTMFLCANCLSPLSEQAVEHHMRRTEQMGANMRYDIKVYDNDYKEKETIRDVSEAQRVSICQTIIRLGGHIKVKEILLIPPFQAADANR